MRSARTQEGAGALEDVLDDIRSGRFVLVTHGEGKDLGGDLVMAASQVTPEAVAFLVRECRGIVHVALPSRRCLELDLKPLAPEFDPGRWTTAMTVSVEARDGVTTGVSAADRARTIRVLADPTTTRNDLVRPGHIVPIAARDGGVFERVGRSEGASDLPQLAGLGPVGVCCGILRADGASAKGEALMEFAGRHQIRHVSDELIAEHRLRTEELIQRTGEVNLPGAGGLRAISFQEIAARRWHTAVFRPAGLEHGGVKCEVNRHCWAGGICGAASCDCAARLAAAVLKASGSEGTIALCLDMVAPSAPTAMTCVLQDAPTQLDELRRACVVSRILASLGVPDAHVA